MLKILVFALEIMCLSIKTKSALWSIRGDLGKTSQLCLFLLGFRSTVRLELFFFGQFLQCNSSFFVCLVCCSPDFMGCPSPRNAEPTGSQDWLDFQSSFGSGGAKKDQFLTATR